MSPFLCIQPLKTGRKSITYILIMGIDKQPKQRNAPLSAGDGLPALMRQTRRERRHWMLRDTIIDRWVKELDGEIRDLLEFREELAGERLVIEDGPDRQNEREAPQS